MRIKIWQAKDANEFQIGLFSKNGLHSLRATDEHILAHTVALEMSNRIASLPQHKSAPPVICEVYGCTFHSVVIK